MAAIGRTTFAVGGTTLEIDRDSRHGIAVQLAHQLQIAIRGRALGGGQKLPSSRSLARALGVGRNAVIEAYEVLRSQGLVTAVRGSATRVVDAPPAPMLTLPDLGRMLREAQYPSRRREFRDPDGNELYAHV